MWNCEARFACYIYGSLYASSTLVLLVLGLVSIYAMIMVGRNLSSLVIFLVFLMLPAAHAHKEWNIPILARVHESAGCVTPYIYHYC